MSEKRFKLLGGGVIFLNTAKPTREQIKEKLFSPEFYLITDEEAFERHLFRKWIKDG